jgi:ubiquitin C
MTESKRKDGMQVFIKTLTGRQMSFDVGPESTVHELKDKLYDKEGIHPAQQRLLYSGAILDCARTLADYNIQKEAVIFSVMRLGAAPRSPWECTQSVCAITGHGKRIEVRCMHPAPFLALVGIASLMLEIRMQALSPMEHEFPPPGRNCCDCPWEDDWKAMFPPAAIPSTCSFEWVSRQHYNACDQRSYSALNVRLMRLVDLLDDRRVEEVACEFKLAESKAVDRSASSRTVLSPVLLCAARWL